MIFSSFTSSGPLGDQAAETPTPASAAISARRGQQQVGMTTTTTTAASPQEGATGRLRRLLQASASRLAAGLQGAGEPASAMVPAGKKQNAAVPAQQQQQQQKTTPAPVDWQLERKFTLSEVQQHSSLDDCWMVIFDKVYNITEFVFEHPGGDFILLEYAGRDATQPFLSSRHGSSAYKMLDKYWIGILVDEELYYSQNSSYCSAYSSLSWRSTPTLEVSPSVASLGPAGGEEPASGTVTNASCSGCEDDDEEEDELDEAISRENSLDSITLRGGCGEELATGSKPEVGVEVEVSHQQQQQQHQQSSMLMIEYHKSYAPTQRRHFMLGGDDDDDGQESDASSDNSEEEPLSLPGEKEEDADSDFGDEQRECNSCGGPSSAALVSLASSATRPQAIVRSWSSSNSTAAAAAGTTTLTTPLAYDELTSGGPTYRLSARSLRWRPSAQQQNTTTTTTSSGSRWSNARRDSVTQQQRLFH